MDLYGADRADDAPICGGSMRILVDPMAAKDRASYAGMAEAVRNRQRGVMLTTVHIEAQTKVCAQWFVQEAIPSDAAFPGADNIRSCMTHERPQLFVKPDGGTSPTLIWNDLRQTIILVVLDFLHFL